MANTIRIKRRASGAAGAPSSLKNAELAFNEVDNVLYYGFGTDVNGNANTILAIAGDGAFVNITGTQTISGIKTFSGNVNLNGNSFAVTKSANNNSNAVATTQYVDSAITGMSHVTSIAGTTNQIAVSSSTGAVTVSLPANVSITTDLSVGGNTTITGNLTVNGTTTTINSTTMSVDDKNVVLADVATPSNTASDGGGITLKGDTDKTFNWVNATGAWTSSEHLNLLTGKAYYINGTSVLSSTTLGSGVTGSSLTSVGTIGTGVWQGTAVAVLYGGTGATSASGARTNLGLGTIATQDSNNVTITGGSISSVTLDLVTLDGGTF